MANTIIGILTGAVTEGLISKEDLQVQNGNAYKSTRKQYNKTIA